jgi:hypothetical protein
MSCMAASVGHDCVIRVILGSATLPCLSTGEVSRNKVHFNAYIQQKSHTHDFCRQTGHEGLGATSVAVPGPVTSTLPFW